jgi:hypothetical protein
VHASIWRFVGDPDELVSRYQSMIAEVSAANMRLHLCLRADDGIVFVDTCPSRVSFDAFEEDYFRSLRRRHGLPEPECVDHFTVHAAFVDGARLAVKALQR